MTHELTLYCLKKIRAQDYMSESEYDNVQYFLEVIFINLFKSLQIYTLAFLLGTPLETFVMNLAYVLLRTSAGGWHAKSSLNCSLLGMATFIGIPLLLQKTGFVFSKVDIILLACLILFCIWRYAPADTEKNPLISVSERKRKRVLSLAVAVFVIFVSLFKANELIQTLEILGLSLEVLMISPLFYKLTKRSYRNYEKYQTAK